jgi:hypothetical protein
MGPGTGLNGMLHVSGRPTSTVTVLGCVDNRQELPLQATIFCDGELFSWGERQPCSAEEERRDRNLLHIERTTRQS